MCHQSCGSPHQHLLAYQVDGPVKGSSGEARNVVLLIESMILTPRDILLDSCIWSCRRAVIDLMEAG